MMIEKPGIYFDFPVPDYHADPCPEPSLNQTCAKLVLEASAAHAMYARLAKPKEDDEERYSRAVTMGNVVHKILLGRGRDVAVANFDDWRTKAAREIRDKAIAEGQTPILKDDYRIAQAICLCAHNFLGKHECGKPSGNAEVVLAWQEGKFWFRSMIDLLSEDKTVVWDIKTTGKVMPPKAVPRMMVDDGWDIQAAMIERGLNVLDPANAGRRKFRFVTIEQNAPHGITVNELPESVMTVGRKRLDAAVKIWQECLDGQRWPGYPLTVNRPEYPPWALAQLEELP